VVLKVKLQSRLVVTLAREMLLQGGFDSLLESKSFFNSLEHIMLDVIKERQFSMDDSEIRQAFPEIMQTVQSFYFYGVKRFDHKLHPRIKAALKK